jgi:hypothetical protein
MPRTNLRTPLPPDTPLLRCPRLPTTQSLAVSDARILAALVVRARLNRREVTRQEIVGSFVLLLAPTDGERLRLLLQETGVATEPYSAPSRLMMRLPSPVSHRLNFLVDAVQMQGRPTTRGALVGALLRRHRSLAALRLVHLLDEYLGSSAGRAIPPSAGTHDLLSRKPPKPGRRRMPPG